MSLVEIIDFNALIDNKQFFDQPVKSKQEPYGKLIEISRNDDYRTKSLLDYLHHQKHYKLIGIDLSRKKKVPPKFLRIPPQIYFTGKLEEDDGVTMFFIAEKWQNTILNFSLNSLIVTK